MPTAPRHRRNPGLSDYHKLVCELVTAVNPDVGLYAVQQLRALSHPERAIVLKANPDCLNAFDLDPLELADVFEGVMDARQWLTAKADPCIRQWLFEDVQADIEADEATVRAARFDAEEPA